MTPVAGFPCYTAAEMVLDSVLHAFAILLAVGGVAWLFAATLPTEGIRQLIGVAVYGVGLIGSFAVSAAYHACHPSRAKELFRRADHAMIFVMFVMIVGTCTPFTLSAFPKNVGLLLGALTWIVATIGVVLTLAFPRRFERPLLALYLVTGRTMFGVGTAYAEHLASMTLLLLFGGGIAYSCGTWIHARSRLPFHNVVWHGSVILGASLHWVAVANQIAFPLRS